MTGVSVTPFFHAVLRTSDVAAARAFYQAVLGTVELDVVQLHEQAVARGARPHWLAFLDVGDVDGAAAAFAQRGATLLGPKWFNPQGLEAAVMRRRSRLPLRRPGAAPRGQEERENPSPTRRSTRRRREHATGAHHLRSVRSSGVPRLAPVGRGAAVGPGIERNQRHRHPTPLK